VALKISEFLEKKLIVITGKGGSGKSLISVALAHKLASQGKKVWLVELGRRRDRAFTRLPELVGLSEVPHRATSTTLPGSKQEIFCSVLDPAQSLAEYVDLKLPMGGLAGILLNNRVTSSFLEVVPGLPDLVSLGKLWHSLTQAQAKFRPDVVVLDGPASGHGIALLKAPQNFKRITKVGPIFRDASQMVDFFQDPSQMAIGITTLPEEMSIQETADIANHLKNFPDPLLFVNRIFPKLAKLELGTHFVEKAYKYSYERSKRENEAIKNLKFSHLSVPFYFPEPNAKPLYMRISEGF
jgi:energy-coupling factor transporter ATP-binding protein EcfA2